MPEIKFYANVKPSTGNISIETNEILHGNGSGIGFYGSQFGVSVPVNKQQTSTFVTNAAPTDGSTPGTAAGVNLGNTAMATVGDSSTQGTVSINSLTAQNLATLPNKSCPLNIRFTHSSAVRVQNCKLRIFDRTTITAPASGVTTYVYEARHPSNVDGVAQLTQRGRSDNSWYSFNSATTNPMVFTSSPGAGGANTNLDQDASSAGTIGWSTREGLDHSSTTHDWYVALSSMPETIGTKDKYGLYFTVEYFT